MGRFDDVGLFWQDVSTTGRGGKREVGPPPPIPETGWVAPEPSDWPDLRGYDVIGLDIETKDPDLLVAGPGWGRGVGHIIGVSMAVPGKAWYFPIRHELCPEENLDPEKVLAYLREQLDTPHQAKVGANITYDIGWLEYEGVKVTGPLIDVQYAEALIDNNARVSLDNLAKKYVGEGKETDILYQWLADWQGGEPDGTQRKHLWTSPPSLVGPYAESDADLPLRVIQAQYPILQREGLLELFDMECKLIPLLIKMRMRGVRVDVPRAERLRDELIQSEADAQQRLDAMVGFHVDVMSRDLHKAFDALDLPYPLTPKGAPSFRKDWLKSLEHPLGKAINEVRYINKVRSTFIESYILDKNVDGIVYCSFHPLRHESGGTGYGRFASSDPNLQNIPSRDKIWAPKLRGLFIPHEGDKQWRKIDYSQIEYRMLGHFATGPSAYLIQDKYKADANTDYHSETSDNIEKVTGQKLENRGHVKNVNFGTLYGMGEAKLRRMLGLDKNTAEAFFAAYHAANPFVKETVKHYTNVANAQGYVTTILGRRARFDLWEPAKFSKDKKRPLPFELAVREYGQVRRAYTHKAINNMLQGSSADQLKLAMLKCYESGVFDVTGVPVLTVHDELDFSDRGDHDEAYKEITNIMETCLTLNVPVIADTEVGPDWGNVKEI